MCWLVDCFHEWLVGCLNHTVLHSPQTSDFDFHQGGGRLENTWFFVPMCTWMSMLKFVNPEKSPPFGGYAYSYTICQSNINQPRSINHWIPEFGLRDIKLKDFRDVGLLPQRQRRRRQWEWFVLPHPCHARSLLVALIMTAGVLKTAWWLVRRWWRLRCV